MGLWQIQPQIILILTSLIIGLVTGLLFDIYRRLRNLISPGPYLTALGDLCFWGLIAVITFTSLFSISSGQIRGYVFFAIGAGLAFYLRFISPYVIWFFVIMDTYIEMGFMKICKLTDKIKRLTPVKLIGRIWEDARRIFSKIRYK